MTALLRWAGSKKQLLPILKQYWKPEFKRYVEPFAGSASLFFDIQPPAAVISDLNNELIFALRQIQLQVHHVLECLRRLEISECAYYKIRAIDPATLSLNERAARFLYLNALCFNGLYRTNAKGQFNVPYGKKHRKICIDESLLLASSKLLNNANINCCDFEATMVATRKGDFVYMDPPYVTTSRRIFSEYIPGSFQIKDLDRLLTQLTALDNRGAKFVLSYCDAPEIAPFREKWTVKKVTARRNIAGFIGDRKQATELIITNCE